MNQGVLLIGVVVGVLAIGFVEVYRRVRHLAERETFVDEYAKRFDIAARGVLSGNFDGEAQYWLTHRLHQMNRELGGRQVIAYRPAFANFYHTEYPVLANTLPLMATGRVQAADVSFCENIMITHLGALHDLGTQAQRDLRNPLAWLQAGVRTIVTAPVWFAYWSGLMRYSTLERVTESWAVRFIGFVALILGLVASVVTLTTGWGPFTKLVHWVP